jgi:hypothetical protein
MDWSKRILSTSEGIDEACSLPEQVATLYRQQESTWPGLRAGLEALGAAETRWMSLRHGQVVLQHNPQRLVSTGAKVDSSTIKQRPCFLCSANMPEEEKGIDFLGRYLIFCNPYPILPEHLVIADREHTPQRLDGRELELITLARLLGPNYVVLYNGPACGASAPDHLHFQAGIKSRLPLIAEVDQQAQRVLMETAGLRVRALEDYRVNVIIGESFNQLALAQWLMRTIDTFQEIAYPVDQREIDVVAPEPMVNLVVEDDTLQTRVYLFPRERHRPSSYFAEGADKLTISPAAIDLAGLLVAPVREDFHRLTIESVERIYREVTLSDSKFAALISHLT